MCERLMENAIICFRGTQIIEPQLKKGIPMKTNLLRSPHRPAASLHPIDEASAIAAREFGLHGMTLPVFARIDPAMCLFAENVLITDANHAGLRYGCHFILATSCGTKALPIIPLRLFSKPCIPMVEDLGATMTEIITGLRLAAPKIHSSFFDLRGAVVAARKQTSDRGIHHNGCRILLSHEIALHVSPQPTPDPPASMAKQLILLTGPAGGYRDLSAA